MITIHCFIHNKHFNCCDFKNIVYVSYVELYEMCLKHRDHINTIIITAASFIIYFVAVADNSCSDDDVPQPERERGCATPKRERMCHPREREDVQPPRKRGCATPDRERM